MMKTMIPPQVGMRLQTLKEKKEKKEKGQKEKREAKEKKEEKKEKEKKMREKELRDNATISFSTLVLQSSTMIFMIESLLCCHFHLLSGNFSL